MSEARSQWAPWEDNAHARLTTRERLGDGAGKACPATKVADSCDPLKRSGCRETPGSLVNRSEPKTPWDVHAVKIAEEPETHEVRVHVSIVQVAEVGRTHRVPCPP